MATGRTDPRAASGLRDPQGGRAATPLFDVYETDTSVVLVADMPGVRPDGLEGVAEREAVTIRGRVRWPRGQLVTRPRHGAQYDRRTGRSALGNRWRDDLRVRRGCRRVRGACDAQSRRGRDRGRSHDPAAPGRRRRRSDGGDPGAVPNSGYRSRGSLREPDSWRHARVRDAVSAGDSIAS